MLETSHDGTHALGASTWTAALALLLLSAALYLPPAVSTPFFTKGEPREGLVVRRMIEEGDWILPKRSSENGWTIASKPPFFHWLGAVASEALGGPSELAIRLPSVLLGLATVLSTWLVARTFLPGVTALFGSIVLATTFEWVRAVSSARVDGTLAALMTTALLLFHRGIVRGGLSREEAIAAYGSLVCATLTKGPVGFLLPGFVLGTALLAYRKLALVPRFRPLLGAVMILVLAGGWYLTAWRLGGDAFVRKHLLKENVFRFLGASALQSGHEHGFFYYLPTFAAGFLPWTPFFLAALVAAVGNRSVRRDPRIGFLLIWLGVVFGFYSAAAAKRSVYLLALYPAAALLTGWWWESLRTAAATPRWLRSRMTRAIVGATGAAVVLPLAIVVAEGLGLAPLTPLEPFLHPKDRANLPIVRGIIDAHPIAIALALAVLLAALCAALLALRRAHWTTLFGAAATLATALWLLVFALFQPELARQRTFGPFLAEVAARVDGRPVSFYPGTFDFGAAFYAPPRTGHWKTGVKHGAGPHYVLVWDDAVASLPRHTAGSPEVVASSTGTEPKGRRHLALVRLP
ncbi:MAG: glycosyltransferase family 39 protein [Deltaproteobacteria bacterium]|nr:glycosyltransferase family 39 protein [Deltaproteobacteria bacterium]